MRSFLIILFFFIFLHGDNNNACYQAVSLSSQTSIDDSLSKKDDAYDFYRFSAQQNEKATLQIQSNAKVDVTITKYWCNDALVETQSGTELEFVLFPLDSADYFITIEAKAGGDIEYTLQFELIAPCTNFIVDDDKQECPNACYQSIQNAIDNAPSKTNIQICAGTYNEYLSINTNDLNLSKHPQSGGDVVVQNSEKSDLITLNAYRSFTLDGLKLEQNRNNYDAIVINTYLDKLSIKNSSITSTKKGVNFQNNIGAFELIESNITSNDDSLFFQTLDKESFIQKSILNSSSDTIEFSKTINANFSVIDSVLNANSRILQGEKIYGTLLFSNTVANSLNRGLNFSNAQSISKLLIENSAIQAKNQTLRINSISSGGATIENSTIVSQESYALRFDNVINGGLHITSSKLFSISNALYTSRVNGGIFISYSDLNSTDSVGAFISDHVYGGGIHIGHSTFTADKEALYLSNNDIFANISSSSFVSHSDHAINTVTLNYNTLSLSDSCITTHNNGSYALRLRINNTNSHINNNCFYANSAEDLAYAWKSGNDFEGNFWDGVSGIYSINNIVDSSFLPSCPHSCNSGDENEQDNSNFGFDLRDTNRAFDDRNISTKIASVAFELTLFETQGQDFNGTVCLSLDNAQWQKVSFSNQSSQDVTFIYDKAHKNGRFFIEWLYENDVSCPLQSSEKNSTLSSDNFAIRPSSYTITTPLQVIAAKPFEISFLASNTQGYNETIGDTFEIEANSTIQECNSSSLAIPNASFVDGNLTFSTHYDDTSTLNITIKENPLNPFAAVDIKDTNLSQLLIEQASAHVDVLAYELNISDFSLTHTSGSSWVYMDDTLEQNGTLSFSVVAQNYNHSILQDFSASCYGKDVNISTSFAHSSPIGFVTNLGLSGALDTNFTLLKSDFTQGKSKTIEYSYNLQRKLDTPLNPVEINITHIASHSNEINNFSFVPLKANSTFYYGRVFSKDYTISQPQNVDIWYEVYCKECAQKQASWIASNEDAYWYIWQSTPYMQMLIESTQLYAISSSKYLRYNIFGENVDNSFFVEFVDNNDTPQSNNVGMHVDTNISEHPNYRIEW